MVIAILAGGLAGISVDFALFPVDQIKTRLMASTADKDYSAQGINYDGFMSSLMASFPCAAMFWLVYETFKYLLAGTFLSSG